MNYEQVFLGSCMLEPTLIDHAIGSGLKADAFTSDDRKRIWLQLLDSRTNSKLTDMQAIFLEMGTDCPADELLACEASAPTQTHGKKALTRVLEAGIIAQLRPALNDALSLIDDGKPYRDIKETVEALAEHLKPEERTEVSLPETVEEAMAWITGQVTGNTADEKVVVTGLRRFDEGAGSIGMHEYVIVGARTSTGKSSFMAQLAQHNLYRGLRVAYFTLETSAKAVILQMAAQRAGVNLRHLRQEFKPRQDALVEEVAKLKEKPLLVFERDLSLEQIEARCRLIAATWKPDLVIIDYLGLIKVNADGAYERMTKLSKAMIPLKKALGCTLIVAAQLNRGNEREDRPPGRTDFRDTGSIEEDAHRVLALHRPSKDDSGQLQGYDRSEYLQELYQLKNRDGALYQTRLTFFAPHTKFIERTT